MLTEPADTCRCSLCLRPTVKGICGRGGFWDTPYYRQKIVSLLSGFRLHFYCACLRSKSEVLGFSTQSHAAMSRDDKLTQ